MASYKEAEDKEHFTFWASNALDQNDAEELHYSYEDLFDTLLKVEKNMEDKGVKLSPKKLSEVINWSILEYKIPEEVKYEINQHIKNRDKAPYTLSFSHQEDTLLMWSIYANSGNGICLVFNEEELSNLKTEMRYISNNVRYNRDKNYITDVIELIYDDYLKSIDKEEMLLLNRVYYEGKIYLKIMLELISPFIKNNAFKDEDEWRIAFPKNNKTKVYTRISGSLNLIHYIKVGLPVSALQKIIIGPCADYNKVIDLLLKEASDCCIEKMTKPEFYIKSNVPYRIF
ncbi:MAG: DUF2971 domain-containing protein [Prevotella sp.]|nr:DUF2971 domain-containing protein [Prevotella sp.]